MKFSKAVWLLAAGGPLALGAFALLLTLGVPGVQDRFWRVEPLNATEAAALRDVARLRVLIEDGESPTHRSPVRSGILGRQAAEMTPLEAGAAIRAGDVIDLLRELETLPSPDQVRRRP